MRLGALNKTKSCHNWQLLVCTRLLFGDLVQMRHGAALYASGGVRLDQVLTNSFVESLGQVGNQFLSFIKLVLGQELTEAAAHVINAFAHLFVAASTDNALA
jgi:hypothetical protein